jgi:CRISPR-associated protein Cmr2
MSALFTAITFAPVQGFIEKSRKLRDLYGSSLILSYLATQVCDAARQHLKSENADQTEDPIISPASINATRGTPNQILIRGKFPKPEANEAFNQAWQTLCDTCRDWIEKKVSQHPEGGVWEYHWHRPWQQWINHAWEFFWAVGDTPHQAKQLLMHEKAARAWTGVNWVGESSTLSGADSRAWPLLGRHSPHKRPTGEEEAEVRAFYQQLSTAIENSPASEAIITPREQLSIPELVKRLVTVDEIMGPSVPIDSPLRTFKDLNRWHEDEAPGEAQRQSDDETAERWTGWFQGDGDRVGQHLIHKPPEALHAFSYRLREWSKRLQHQLPQADVARNRLDRDGRIIYAGGDDFLGILYRNKPDPPLAPQECVDWFSTFKSQVWAQHEQDISVSVGFVWAAPKVPQRDVLQHCREAQDAAKDHGRDRIAFRILFNGGNYLEWVCPWWLLEAGLLEKYRDRNGIQGDAANWTHIFTDVATLESRHGFAGNQNEVALSLLQIYFDDDGQDNLRRTIETHRWDVPAEKRTGILGNRPEDVTDPVAALNKWIINLAKVGFHLCSNT